MFSKLEKGYLVLDEIIDVHNVTIFFFELILISVQDKRDIVEGISAVARSLA